MLTRLTLPTALLVFVACTPEQAQPPGDDSGATGTTAPGTTTGEPTTGTTAVPTTDATDATTQPVTGGSTGDCDGDTGCWACPPQTDEQVKNACTDANCQRFDDEARLPLLGRDGALPPLP